MSPAEVLLETRVADSSSSLDLADPSLILFRGAVARTLAA